MLGEISTNTMAFKDLDLLSVNSRSKMSEMSFAGVGPCCPQGCTLPAGSGEELPVCHLQTVEAAASLALKVSLETLLSLLHLLL